MAVDDVFLWVDGDYRYFIFNYIIIIEGWEGILVLVMEVTRIKFERNWSSKQSGCDTSETDSATT